MSNFTEDQEQDIETLMQKLIPIFQEHSLLSGVACLSMLLIVAHTTIDCPKQKQRERLLTLQASQIAGFDCDMDYEAREMMGVSIWAK